MADDMGWSPKTKKRPGKERKSLAKSKFEEFSSFGGS